MNYTKRCLLASLVCVVVITGCKKEESNPAGGSGGTTGITITVSSGTKPQYSWTGGNVFSLSVMRTSNPATIVWGLSSPNQNAIASPVTHGTGSSLNPMIVETGTSEKSGLTAGVQYRVSVTRLDGTTGYTEFTP